MKALRSIVSSAFLIAIVSAGSDPALAQEKEPKPTPGPEHKKLGYFVGDWSTEGEMKANSLAPAGKYSTSDHCKWFEGNFALVCQSEGKSPAGPTKAHYVLGYSTEEKIYVYYGIDNSAMVPTTVAKGSVQRGTWTYTHESRMSGQVAKSLYTLT